MANFETLEFIVRIPAILYAISIHEFFHAFTANKCGDDTAKRLGRVSMNPLAHLDPIGTVALLIGVFGWGKPVPVNPNNFRNPRWNDVLVSFAGPFSNFISAIIFGIITRVFLVYGDFIPKEYQMGIFHLLVLSVNINLGLAFFNMIPLFPLDGSHILSGFLPRPYARRFELFNMQMPYLLFGIILADYMLHLNIISTFLIPPITFFFRLFTGIA